MSPLTQGLNYRSACDIGRIQALYSRSLVSSEIEDLQIFWSRANMASWTKVARRLISSSLPPEQWIREPRYTNDSMHGKCQCMGSVNMGSRILWWPCNANKKYVMVLYSILVDKQLQLIQTNHFLFIVWGLWYSDLSRIDIEDLVNQLLLETP